MGDNNNKKISFKLMIAAGGLVLATATSVAALMSNIYATKAEVAELNLKAERTSWKAESMATRIQNIERRQIHMSENITKLLARLRVPPADPPYLTPMPRAPILPP